MNKKQSLPEGRLFPFQQGNTIIGVTIPAVGAVELGDLAILPSGTLRPSTEKQHPAVIVANGPNLSRPHNKGIEQSQVHSRAGCWAVMIDPCFGFIPTDISVGAGFIVGAVDGFAPPNRDCGLKGSGHSYSSPWNARIVSTSQGVGMDCVDRRHNIHTNPTTNPRMVIVSVLAVWGLISTSSQR
jgi:hypothetical protein